MPQARADAVRRGNGEDNQGVHPAPATSGVPDHADSVQPAQALNLASLAPAGNVSFCVIKSGIACMVGHVHSYAVLLD